jgi:hypothetical protein
MATYRVLQHPKLGKKAVRQGFAWEVFISETYLGASRHVLRLLLLGLIGFVLIELLLNLWLASPPLEWALSLTGFGLFLYCGFNMNTWYADLLVEQGYQYLTTVDATSAPAALSQSK